MPPAQDEDYKLLQSRIIKLSQLVFTVCLVMVLDPRVALEVFCNRTGGMPPR